MPAFDRLRPNGEGCKVGPLDPFTLSLSKGRSSHIAGFDRLSPNGVVVSKGQPSRIAGCYRRRPNGFVVE